MWNLMNKLNKENGDRLIYRHQADSWGGRIEVGRTKQNQKRTHGQGQQCGDCAGEGIKGLNGNEKRD